MQQNIWFGLLASIIIIFVTTLIRDYQWNRAIKKGKFSSDDKINENEKAYQLGLSDVELHIDKLIHEGAMIDLANSNFTKVYFNVGSNIIIEFGTHYIKHPEIYIHTYLVEPTFDREAYVHYSIRLSDNSLLYSSKNKKWLEKLVKSVEPTISSFVKNRKIEHNLKIKDILNENKETNNE